MPAVHSLAPIFQRCPSLDPDNPVRLHAMITDIDPERSFVPFGVFVSKRNSFECFIAEQYADLTPIEIAFVCCPLFENGWRRDQTETSKVRDVTGGTIWRLTRVNTIRPLAPSSGRDRAPADCAHSRPPTQRTTYCGSAEIPGGTHA